MALSPQELGRVLRYLDPKYVKAYEEGELDDTDLRQWAEAAGVLSADFSGVSASVDTTADDPAEGPSFVDRALTTGGVALDSVIGGGKRSMGAQLFTEAELGADEDSLQGRAIDTLLTPFTGLSSAITDSILAQYDPDGSKQKLLGTAMFREGSDEVQAANERALAGDAFGDTLTQGIGDFAATPSSALSVFGGPTAAIVAGDVFAQEYTGARLAGLDQTDAGVRAGAMASLEGGISAIPAGRFLNKIPGLDSVLGREAMERLSGDVAKTVARVTKTTAGEAAEEGLTTLAQLGMDKALSEVAPSEALREYSKSNIPKDIAGVWDETWRSIVAGGVGGTAVGGPTEVFRTVAERGRMVSELTQEMDRQVADRAVQTEITPTPVETTEWMREGRTREQDIDEAFRQRDAARVATPDPEIQRQNLVGAVDAARERVEVLQDAIENGDTSQSTLSSLASSVRDVNRAEQTLTRYEQSIAPAPAVEPAPVAVEAPVVEGPVAPAPERVAAREKARESVSTLLEKDNKKQRASALSARAAARRTFIRTRAAELGDLAPEERIERISDDTLTWDEQNPIENFFKPVTSTATKKGAKVARGKPAARPKATPVADDPEDVRKVYQELHPDAPPEAIEKMVSTHNDTGELDLDQLKASVGLASTGSRATDTTTKDVLNSLVTNMGKGSAKKLSKLIIDGNLRVVDSADQVPDGAAPEGAAGFYDGQRTYVVASRLDPKNVVGDMLEIAAHEVKHAADLGGSANLRATLGGFVGDRANTQLRKKIEALAARDNVVAQAAVSRATAAEEANPGSYDLELAAYFINEARNQRAKGGLVGSVLGDAVSAVRTAAKKIMPGDYEVNLNDVAYLSDKLIAETAVAGESLAAPNALPKALPMIIGPKAKNFSKFAGRRYRSKDGALKAVVTDADSTLTLNFEMIVEMKDGQHVPVTQILNHPSLFENYPQLENTEVFINPDLAEYNAVFLENEGEGIDRIAVAPDFFNDVIWGADGAADNLRGVLLHELQHSIQSIEGTSLGGNPKMFRTEADRRLMRQHNKNIETFKDVMKTIEGMEFDPRLPIPKRTALGKLYNLKNTRRISIRELAESLKPVLLTGDNGRADDVIKRLAQQLDDIITATNLSTRGVNEILSRTQQQYFALLGEQEAANTQYNLNIPQEDLPFNPEDEYASRGFSETQPLNANAYDGTSILTDPTLAPSQYPRMSIGLPFTPQINAAAKNMMVNPRNQAIITLRQALVTYGGMGKAIGQDKELADGMAAVYSHKAMKYYGRLKEGVDQMAKRTKSTPEQIDQLIRKRMELIATLPNAQRRLSALASFVRENPELAPLGQAMQEVAALSRTLLHQMLEDNPNPTPEEIKLMNTINSNYFRYTTQMYAAFQGQEGRTRNELLQKQYRAGRDALAKGGTVVPPKYRDAFKTWTKAQKYLIDNELRIPDEEGLRTISQSRLDNLYATWVGDAGRTKKIVFAQAREDGMTIREAKEYVNETMRQALIERSASVNDTQLQGKADTLIQAMLGLGNAGTPFAAYYRGFKQDRSILENRVGLPQEIKDLFGEIKDPAVRLAVTIAKQGELAGRTRLLMDMKTKGEGKFVIPPHLAGTEGTEKFSATLEGESYGPLAGWKTTPEIAGAISDTLEMFSTGSDALAQAYSNTDQLVSHITGGISRGVTNLASVQKLFTIVFDAYNLSLNAAGSPLMLMANGVTDVGAIKNAVGVGIESIIDTATDGRAKLSDSFESQLEEAIRYGILDSARVQEIRRTPQKFVRALIDTKPKAVGSTARRASRAKNTAVETYAMADAWVKIAAFQARTNMLTKFYEAEGVKKSSSAIKKEASNTIKDTNITYARTPALVRMFERIGLTTFMPYFVSVFRSIGYNYAVGVKDAVRAAHATTPKGKAILAAESAKRLAGTTAATAGFTYALKALASLISGDDEEEIDEMQKLMFPDARFADSIFLGKDNTGVPLFARMSRVDPFGPATDALRILLDEDTTPEQKGRFVVDMYKDMVITNRATAGILKATMEYFTDEELKDKGTKFERITGKGGAQIKDWIDGIPTMDYGDANSVLQFIDSLTPGIFDVFDPRNKGVTSDGAEPREGEVFEMLSMFVTHSGGRLDRADPGMAAYVSGKELNDVRKEYRKRLNEGVVMRRSQETLQDLFIEGSQLEHEKFTAVTDVYSGMVNGLRMSPAKAMETLKDEGSLTADDIAAIRNARPNSNMEDWLKHSRLVRQDSIEKDLERDMEEMTPEEKRATQKDINQFLKNMKDLYGVNTK